MRLTEPMNCYKHSPKPLTRKCVTTCTYVLTAVLTADLAYKLFLACDVFIRMNRNAITMMFIDLSVCLEWMCIVIIWCTVARI